MKKSLTKKLNWDKKSELSFKDKTYPFKIAIIHELDKGFDFKSLSVSGLKNFHNLIHDILSKKLTIAEVEKLYMRTHSKPLEKRWTNEQLEVREIHLGKNRNPFRLFGYLNKDNYFVLTKIDPNHEFHD
ncbi:MAG6450 family protein [Mycoplasma mycoides]|uniref:MAG6450 family protein n=1 Tax=Mycoplasma mycoides TaxID=2102 RepID=UPI00224049B5|nr:hypothetical protein [Mycoplasma mycoides]QVK05587.1 hypothetical protein I7640_01990 [Mycoplasma mycoides subsp. capri]